MPALHGGFGDGDVVAVDRRVFLDDDGVGAVGNDAAGENPHRFAARRPSARTGGRRRPRRSPSAAPRDRRRQPRARHSRPSPTSPAAAGCAVLRRRAPAPDDRPRRARPFPRATGLRRQGSRQVASATGIRATGKTPSNPERGKRRRDVIRRCHMHRGQAPCPRALRYCRRNRRRTRYARRARRSLSRHDHRPPLRVSEARSSTTDRSRGNGRAHRHRLAKNARHARRWCWRRHRAAAALPARASIAAMPGISPAKIAFHPSRNCVSVMSMPSDARRLSKKAASLISPRSCRCQASSGENRPTRCAGSQPAWPAQLATTLLKSMSSTTRPRSNSSASAELGMSGEFMAVVYKTGRAGATGHVPRMPNPALKPVRKLC